MTKGRGLEGKVALVSGATRGVGKGIALVLGEAGATVYVTGRSSRSRASAQGYPGTVEETAEAVTARGGLGIPQRCDHSETVQVRELMERIKEEHGSLDILVNNGYGGGDRLDELANPRPFWESGLETWDAFFTRGLRNHLITTRLAIPLLRRRPGGLILITSYWAYDRFMHSTFYDVAMTAQNRLAFGMAEDLRTVGIAAIAISPGFVKTELVDATYDGDRTVLESVEYTGRAVVALATDPTILEKSGRTLVVGELAREYGFTDVDGRQPPPFAPA